MYRVQKFDSTTTAMHWQIHKDAAADWRGMGERMDVAIALGTDPATCYTASAPLPEAHRRAHARRLPARRAGRAGALQDGRPRGAGPVRDRDRGLHREGRAARRGPVRRPHGLLHAGRAVPGRPRHVRHAQARPDLPVDHRRRAAAGGRVAGEGNRAPVPARGPDDAARGGRLRPAVHGRVPQPRHRLDQEGVSRATRARSCTRSGARASCR